MRLKKEEKTEVEIVFKLSPKEMRRVMTTIMDYVMEDFKGKQEMALPREIVVPMLKRCASFNDMMRINYNGVTYKLSDEFSYNNHERSSSDREKFLSTYNTFMMTMEFTTSLGNKNKPTFRVWYK
jgi:hypothetical protein